MSEMIDRVIDGIAHAASWFFFNFRACEHSDRQSFGECNRNEEIRCSVAVKKP
jgi:hypothetical protein